CQTRLSTPRSATTRHCELVLLLTATPPPTLYTLSLHDALPISEGEAEKDDHEVARIIRYANRVPLLYQPAACEITKAVLDTTWRNYGVAQSRGSPPAGPMVIFVHMASVWVPFTSESKEAIAEY